MANFPRLFESFKIGSVLLANRIVVPPHGTDILHEGMVNADDEAYFEARASSGVGLIVTGAMIVHPTAVRCARKSVEAYDERVVENLSFQASIAGKYNVKMIGLLFYLGREGVGEEFEYSTSAPSLVRSPRDTYSL
jgi:2,4-dienoyl-CoA reductase-like NADH-dependent reductase (Old Yellow Enzyme family)